jgi:hypothetical protein
MCKINFEQDVTPSGSADCEPEGNSGGCEAPPGESRIIAGSQQDGAYVVAHTGNEYKVELL